MLQLFALKVAIAIWKTSIDLSNKLRPKTWMVLAVLNAAISVSALYAYHAKLVPDSIIPPIHHAELKPVPLPDSFNVLMVALSSPSNELSEHILLPSNQWYLAVLTKRSNFEVYPHIKSFAELPWDLPKWPEQARPTVVVQVSESQAPDLLTYFEKRVALAVSVITALLSIVNFLLAFQALRTLKAERELKTLQIAHLRLQVERLQVEIEEAKREKDKTNGIVLVQ